MADNGNPFDRPLASEVQDHQAAQAATVATSANGNPFDEPLLSEKAEAQAQANGQITNDVGNTVIVPKDGESFSDTMKRAASQGQQTTPEQINKEIATAPGKAATVLAAAPVVGAAGAAALAAPGEASEVGSSLVDKAKAIYEWAKLNPFKAAGVEGIAREMGVDPFQLAHKVVKYGKNLFGDSEATK